MNYSIITVSHFRDDDLADTVVIDKINIFRADRVFKVFCFISYLISQSIMHLSSP
jgi:hypothetical protein